MELGTTTVGVPRESAAGERRVALTPDGVVRLAKLGLRVVVESGAGRSAGCPDDAYAEAGAEVADRAQVYAASDVVVCVRPPADVASLRAGQILVGLLNPLAEPGLAAALADAKVSAVSLDTLPRTLSRAQAMDALTSQANVAGYKAALVAADAYEAYLPMLMTAAGTTPPAQVLVIGAGVAGLQAIATARRLGAVVTAYDVRDAARADIASTGAAILDLGVGVGAVDADGYARPLTEAESAAQRAALDAAIGRFDIVITTAQVPGRRPPRLVSAAALAGMRPGSVVVDTAAGELGGNVAGSVPDATIRTEGGVTVIGAGNLPSALPRAASTAYSRNIAALLTFLVRDGDVVVDGDDEIRTGVVISHDGRVVHVPTQQALARAGAGGRP